MAIFDFFKRKKKDAKEELKELLEGYSLPSFPAAVMKVLQMLRDPNFSISEISRHIEIDPGMHVMVLKAVNSVSFGLTRKVANIQHAITLLGRSRLETLILPIAVKMTMHSNKFHCLTPKLFWITCARRAAYAKVIAEKLTPSTQMEAFTAGLLQDMAIPVLINVKKDPYCTTLSLWNQDETVVLHEIEKEKFGFDHQSVGALMAESWNFPQSLIDAILYHHHNGTSSKGEKAVSMVSELRYIEGADEETPHLLISNILKEKVRFSEEQTNSIIESAEKEADEFAAIFS